MAIKHLKFLTNSVSGQTSSTSPTSTKSSSSENRSNSNISSQKEKVENFRQDFFRQDLVENESYRLGFKECLSETLRFLVEFEGFSLNQDFIQYPGGQSASPSQNGEMSGNGNGGNGNGGNGNGGNGNGGGFHLTKLVAHLNSHLEGVVESRLKHPQEISCEELNWQRNSQFLPPKSNSFEIKVTTVDEMATESDMPMEESGFELRNMLLPDSKRNIFHSQSAEEMSNRREMVESPVLSTSSQSKGSYKKEIKDRFLRMRVESTIETSAADVSTGNRQDRQNLEKTNNDGTASSFFSSASSSSGSSNGSLSSNSSTSSFPVFHPNNRGRSYSVNTYGPLCARSVGNEVHEQKEGNNLNNVSSTISIFGFALHPSRSFYIPFHSKTTNLHETLTNSMIRDSNPSTIDQNVRNFYPISINVKFDSLPDL